MSIVVTTGQATVALVRSLQSGCLGLSPGITQVAV